VYSEKHSALVSVNERQGVTEDSGLSKHDGQRANGHCHNVRISSSIAERKSGRRRTNSVPSNQCLSQATAKTRKLRDVGHRRAAEGKETVGVYEMPRERQKKYDQQQRSKADATLTLENREHTHRIKNAKPKICVEEIQRLKRESKMSKMECSVVEKANRNVKQPRPAIDKDLPLPDKPRKTKIGSRECIRQTAGGRNFARGDWNVEIYAPEPPDIPRAVPSTAPPESVDVCHFLDVTTVYVPAPTGPHNFSGSKETTMGSTMFTIHQTPRM